MSSAGQSTSLRTCWRDPRRHITAERRREKLTRHRSQPITAEYGIASFAARRETRRLNVTWADGQSRRTQRRRARTRTHAHTVHTHTHYTHSPGLTCSWLTLRHKSWLFVNTCNDSRSEPKTQTNISQGLCVVYSGLVFTH